MQSFPLRRLPLLAVSEVIKSMDIREIFLFSLASKKSQNFVMLSIPKNSFWIIFVIKAEGLLFELRPQSFFKHKQQILPYALDSVQEESSLMKVCSNNRHVQCDFSFLSGTSEVEESTRKLFYRFLKTFKNTEIYMELEESSREGFAIELIKFAWENGIPFNKIDFRSKNASSESIQELLNGCHKQHTSLHIETRFPDGFKYLPPPGGYKFESLTVSDAHWINLDDFLQCQKLLLSEMSPDLTPEYLNGLLKKIVNLECGLESFTFELKSIKPSDFAEVVRGLSESKIIQNEDWQGLQFERKDGMKMLISLYRVYLDLEEDYL